MSKKSKALKQISVCAVFCALMAVCAQTAIPLPFGVSLTLQTFAVALCGYTLGVKGGIMSTAAYILLGAVGLPVFTAFKGGIGAILGATGGFIIGFLPFVALCGILSKKGFWVRFAVGLSGLVACHICGVLMFAIITQTGIAAAFLRVSAPFFIKDAASVLLALTVANRIRPFIEKRTA